MPAPRALVTTRSPSTDRVASSMSSLRPRNAASSSITTWPTGTGEPSAAGNHCTAASRTTPAEDTLTLEGISVGVSDPRTEVKRAHEKAASGSDVPTSSVS